MVTVKVSVRVSIPAACRRVADNYTLYQVPPSSYASQATRYVLTAYYYYYTAAAASSKFLCLRHRHYLSLCLTVGRSALTPSLLMFGASAFFP